MTWTQTVLNIKDAGNTSQPVIAYSDGTNYSFAHPLLDHTGAIVGGTNALPVSSGVNVITGNTTTRPADTTAYALGDLMANSTTAGSVSPATIAAARGTDVPTAALRCRLKKSSTNAGLVARVHFFNAAPTVSNGDNGAFLPTLANWVGSFDVTVNQIGSDVAMGIGAPTYGSAMCFKPVSGTQNLYYLIECRSAYTPASAEVFTPILEIN